MGENGSLSASDVALLSDRNFNGLGDSSFFWIFALLILANGGIGGLGNNFTNAIGYENLATSNEVQRGFDNQNSMANQREILAAVNSGTAQSVAASNQVFHDTIGYVGDKYDELARDVAALAVGQANALANQNACCCDLKQLVQATSADTSAQIAQSKYETAMQIAGVESRLSAKMDANEIQNLRDQVGQLQLAQATNNVVRYPSNTYYAVPSPCFNSGCGCGGFNNI